MAGLTTHILDLTHGKPAADVAVVLYACDENGSSEKIAETRTNSDGRAPAPLLDENNLKVGRYRIDFHIGGYFRALGVEVAEPAFLDVVSIAFGVADAFAHYHVPLLVSPYGYSTYRGS